jgi:hypothetical protein
VEKDAQIASLSKENLIMIPITFLCLLTYLCVKNYDAANYNNRKGGVAVLYTIGLWIAGGVIALLISFLLEYILTGSLDRAFFDQWIVMESPEPDFALGEYPEVTISFGGSFAEDMVQSKVFHNIFLYIGNCCGGYLAYRLANKW